MGTGFRWNVRTSLIAMNIINYTAARDLVNGKSYRAETKNQNVALKQMKAATMILNILLYI